MASKSHHRKPLPPRGGFGTVVRFWHWFSWGLREHGVRTMAEDVLSTLNHYTFDLRYGTDTRASVELKNLTIESENKARGVGYQPSTPALFHRIMRLVALPPGSVFVDVGCGMGRALLMAASYDFKRIVGIEFSPALCAIARRNVEIFRRRTGVATPIEIIEADVAEYDIRNDQNVFYMFNPFDDVVMESLLDRIEQSRARTPRVIWLVYLYPTRRHVIEHRASYALRHVVRYGGGDIVLYCSAS